MIDYATAGDLLEALRQVTEEFDGDRLVALYADDAEYRPDPFGPALTGHNEIRAYWSRATDGRRQTEMTVERHWVSGRTILASWHLSFVRVDDGARVRIHGFTTLELRAGTIERHREWSQAIVTPVVPG